jgi:hypothetical protein
MKLVNLIGTLIVYIALGAPSAALAQPTVTPEQAYDRYTQLTGTCAAVVQAGTPCEKALAICQAAPEEDALETALTPATRQACLPAVLQPNAAGSARSVHWAPAITDFLVGRARAELVVFLKEQVADALCGKAIGKELLVDTCVVLDGSDDLLGGLPEALRRDFDALPTRLRDAAVARIPTLTDETAKLATCLAVAAWDAYPVLRDEGPLAALRWLADYAPPEGCPTQLAHVQRWTKLLAPAIESVVVGTMTGQPIDVPALRAVLRELVASDPDFTAEDQARLTVAIPALARLIETIRLVGAANGSVDAKTVGQATALFARSLAELMPDAQRPIFGELLRGIADLATKRYASGLHHLFTAAEAALPAEGFKVLRALAKWGVLLSSLASAETDAEVRSILEAASAPIGSWREFRRGGIAGFLGGFAGISGGVEVGVGDTVAAGAPFLPVGLELGGPIGGGWSLNVLFSVVDLGALGATRLDDDDVEGEGMDGVTREEPAVDLMGVFAPGVFVGFGAGETPIVFGAGVEYLPASRRVFDCPDAAPCDSTRGEAAVRAMGFIAIDLPVLPLFH